MDKLDKELKEINESQEMKEFEKKMRRTRLPSVAYPFYKIKICNMWLERHKSEFTDEEFKTQKNEIKEQFKRSFQ